MHNMTPKQTGTVYLIGAGPGDPELMTLRGLRLLMRADVVLHDRLVDPRLLHYAPPGARLVYVGKQAGQSNSQEWIQRLMIAEACKGHHVVRLKGGDPFVFGRGGEEMEALAHAGIDYEVVPGISSAIAVPELAHIPVLHRDHASMLTIVSGHHCRQAEIATWAAGVAQSATLVILMGMANLARIVNGLRQAGVSADTPTAVIASGSTRHENIAAATLSDIEAAAQTFAAPAIIVVGDVVNVYHTLHRHPPTSRPIPRQASHHLPPVRHV